MPPSGPRHERPLPDRCADGTLQCARQRRPHHASARHTGRNGRYDKRGTRFLYQDRKGFEDEWRKHHTSSITRDIWLYDTATGRHTNLTDRAGEDRNPVFSPDGNQIYCLSERDGGTFNVYSFPLDRPSEARALTSFKTHPVRFLSVAADGTLCYTYDGEIYTQRPVAVRPNWQSRSPVTMRTSPPCSATTAARRPPHPRPTASKSPSSCAAKYSSRPSNTARRSKSPTQWKPNKACHSPRTTAPWPMPASVEATGDSILQKSPARKMPISQRYAHRGRSPVAIERRRAHLPAVLSRRQGTGLHRKPLPPDGGQSED